MLTRTAFLAFVPTFPKEEVFVEEWNDTVFVRVLTGAERDAIEVDWEKTGRKNFRARLVLAATCDSEGKPFFLPQDLPAIGNQPAPILIKICDVAFRLNRFTKADQEELEKNSDRGPADGS